jgi:hypothetical protein
MVVGSIPGSRFDSELDVSMVNGQTNAELTLFLRVCLTQVPGGQTIQDANNNPNLTFQTHDWTPGAWSRFCQVYQRDAQQFWTGKFWLVTPNDYGDLDWPDRSPTHRPNVWCRLRVSVVTASGRPHKTIRVVRLVPPRGQSYDAGTFRSQDDQYDNFDLGTVTYIRDRRRYRQRTIIHEVGHALDLPHIGVMAGIGACPADNTNADDCYGVTDAHRQDVMGFGHRLSTHDALPWRRRIAQHTGTGDTAWAPFLIRHYPRRLGSFAGMSTAH